MDLNKFKSLSINNVNNVKSPLRRLRNRTIYPNIEIIAVSTKDPKSSEELQSNSISCSLNDESNQNEDTYSKSRSDISLARNSIVCDSESDYNLDVDEAGELIYYDENSDDDSFERVVEVHQSLQWMMKVVASARLVRWALRLAEYDFIIKYKKGSSRKRIVPF